MHQDATAAAVRTAARRLVEQEERHREEMDRLIDALTHARSRLLEEHRDKLDARRQIEIERTDRSRVSRQLRVEKLKMRVGSAIIPPTASFFFNIALLCVGRAENRLLAWPGYGYSTGGDGSSTSTVLCRHQPREQVRPALMSTISLLSVD